MTAPCRGSASMSAQRMRPTLGRVPAGAWPGRGETTAYLRPTRPAPDGGVWTTDAARREALRLLGAIKGGLDPLEARPQSPTFADLSAMWLGELATKRKSRTIHGYGRALRRRATPALGKSNVDAIGRQAVARLHHSLRRTPAEANYLVRVLSSFFTWCERNGYRPDTATPPGS